MFSEMFSKIGELAKNTDTKGFKEIKSKGTMDKSEVKGFWNKAFDTFENRLDSIVKDYFKDLKDRSEFTDTLPKKAFDSSELRMLSAEEKTLMREEFDRVKPSLRTEWEEKNGYSWPVYEKDVYNTNKNGEVVKIREVGQPYDMHHIKPLCMGGKNEVSNITPMHASEHFDHKGIHESGSPYSKLKEMLGAD